MTRVPRRATASAALCALLVAMAAPSMAAGGSVRRLGHADAAAVSLLRMVDGEGGSQGLMVIAAMDGVSVEDHGLSVSIGPVVDVGWCSTGVIEACSLGVSVPPSSFAVTASGAELVADVPGLGVMTVEWTTSDVIAPGLFPSSLSCGRGENGVSVDHDASFMSTPPAAAVGATVAGTVGDLLLVDGSVEGFLCGRLYRDVIGSTVVTVEY